ncbi:MAG TPA: ABC transporter substrate-binding protein [Stellaceae bacterium]|jgi:peptide/nickel transport system substrate-binding protein|nr:ABC transporter substrate-binding protein [Stellaceae bacterium]
MIKISRREFGALASAALLFRTQRAVAGEPGVFVFGQDLPANLDPHQIQDLGMTQYALNTYDNLYRYEDNPPKMRPWLATDHTVSADGLIWEFKLREGVKFHDGSEVTGADVVYSFQRLLALGRAPAAPWLSVLKPDSVTAPDRYLVRITLGQRYGPFFGMMPSVFIVNPRIVEAHKDDNDWGARWLASNEAGSGAYRLNPATYVPRERADVEKFDGHFYGWSDNAQPINRIEWRPTKVTSTRVLALLNGTIDMTDSFLPVDQVERIEKSANAHVAKNVTMRLLVIRMNNTKPPFDNINARKCFAHSFNYTGFIDEIVKGNAQRNPAPLPNNIWGYPKDVKGYEFDLAKAKEYFDKAVAEGAPMRRPVEMHVQQPLEQTTQAGQLFQSDLATIGINLKLVNDTFANMTSASVKAESTPQMWIHWISTYYVDPDNWIGQMYDSRFHGTWKASCWYSNPQVDDLLRKARFTSEQEDRAPLYEQAARLVVADSPDIWIYNMIEVCGVANRVQGFRHCPVGSGGEVRWMRLSA